MSSVSGSFQLQTGSIRSIYTGIISESDWVFQFQTGSIRRDEAEARKLIEGLSFNSKLVRLEVTHVFI